MNIRFRFRLIDLMLLAVVLLIAMALISPQQIPVAMYKICLISLAAIVGYWLDRSLFPYSRPDSYLNTNNWLVTRKIVGKKSFEADFPIVPGYDYVFAAAMIRRAIIVGSVVVGVALGL